MNIVNLLRGAIALVAVALVSLIPYVGSIVIAPVVVLMISAEAGRRAAARAGSRPANEAAKAGAIVGVGALIGSIVGLTILLSSSSTYRRCRRRFGTRSRIRRHAYRTSGYRASRRSAESLAVS